MTKLVTVFPGNDEVGLPSHQALIVLFEEDTGRPLAIMDGTHITAVRTAATSAVASKVLARAESSTLTILGAGAQGGSHLDAFGRSFDLREIRISSREPARAEELASRHPLARAVASFEDAVRGADIVCCCTSSADPVIHRSWLTPGAHVVSVGTGVEVDPQTISAARIFVEWRGAAESPPPAGAQELQGLRGDEVTEIGEVLLGRRPGRESDDAITLFKSTGHAVEDAAAAALVYRNAAANGAGRRIAL